MTEVEKSIARYRSFKHWKANSEIAHFKTSLVDRCNDILRVAPRIEKAYLFYGDPNPILTEEDITAVMQECLEKLQGIVKHINEHKEWYDRNNNPISI